MKALIQNGYYQRRIEEVSTEIEAFNLAAAEWNGTYTLDLSKIWEEENPEADPTKNPYK